MKLFKKKECIIINFILFFSFVDGLIEKNPSNSWNSLPTLCLKDISSKATSLKLLIKQPYLYFLLTCLIQQAFKVMVVRKLFIFLQRYQNIWKFRSSNMPLRYAESVFLNRIQIISFLYWFFCKGNILLFVFSEEINQFVFLVRFLTHENQIYVSFMMNPFYPYF